MTYNKEKGTN